MLKKKVITILLITFIISSLAFSRITEKVTAKTLPSSEKQLNSVKRANLKIKLKKIDLHTPYKKGQPFKKEVFKNGIINNSFGSKYYRIPFCAVTNVGTLIVGSDIRYNGVSDYGRIDVGVARSEDGGKTFKDYQIVLKNNAIDPLWSRKMDACILVSRTTGRIFIFSTAIDIHYHDQATNSTGLNFVYKYSDNDGKTWSTERSLKSLFPADTVMMFDGPGSGIQLKNGMLVIPVQNWINDGTRKGYAGIIYSSDNGVTWNLNANFLKVESTESTIIEYVPNNIMIISRADDRMSIGKRIYTTTDLGATAWKMYSSDNTILEPIKTQSNSLKFTAKNGKDYVLMTALSANATVSRIGPTLFSSTDFKKWNTISPICEYQTNGYSCVAYDKIRNKLYVVSEELAGGIFVNDVSYLLPKIMKYPLYIKK